MWILFSISGESTGLTSSKDIDPLSSVLYHLFLVKSGASQTEGIFSCSYHRLTEGQLLCFFCLSLWQILSRWLYSSSAKEFPGGFFWGLMMKYHCANMCECRVVTEWQVFDLFSQKGKKTHCHKAWRLESKNIMTLELRAVHLWVFFFLLEIFEVGRGNSLSFWPNKNAVFTAIKSKL